MLARTRDRLIYAALLLVTLALGVLVLAFASSASAAVSFTPPAAHPVAGGPIPVATGDFNSDSDPDLAVGIFNVVSADNVSVLLGGAGGSFGAPTPFASGEAPLSIAVGDFNADSDPDLAVVESDPASSGYVSVLLGGAGGSFGAPTFFATGAVPRSVAIGDFNADSDPDLAVAGGSSAREDGEYVSILLGGAGGTFGVRTQYTTGAVPRSVAVGDFNADSDPDLAVANRDSDNVSILLGGAGGSFDPQTTFAAGDFLQSIAVGDFNADTDPDLAVVGSDASVMLGGAGGSFDVQTPTTFSGDDFAQSVAVGDFNADSSADLAVAVNSLADDTVSILLNTSKPAVGRSPASLGFGEHTLSASSAPKGVAVTNTGDNRLQITDVRIVGADQLDFNVTQDLCEGETILVGDGCAVRVNFSPSAEGPRSASLRIMDNAPGSPHFVPLSGNGAVPLCAGVSATIVGTPGSDSLTGTASNDVVALLGGDDSFSSAGGSDSVCAGTGSDDLVGGSGADTLRGQDGDDQLRGAPGKDAVFGGSGDDELDGGAQRDKCKGGSDIDTAVACETQSNIP